MDMSCLNFFAVLLIFICTLSTVSSDCSSCCDHGTGCSTAYNRAPGFCCGSGIYRFCCPSGYVCDAYPYCRYYYFGTLSLAALIGIILGSIFLCVLLSLICRQVCANQGQRTVNETTIVTAYRNPGAYQASPYQPSGYPPQQPPAYEHLYKQ